MGGVHLAFSEVGEAGDSRSGQGTAGGHFGCPKPSMPVRHQHRVALSVSLLIYLFFLMYCF